MLDCLGWLLQKTCICFHTSPPAACLSQMRNKRRCVWSQNYLWAKRRPASRKTIRNSQQDTTILHLPTPFTENPKKIFASKGAKKRPIRGVFGQKFLFYSRILVGTRSTPFNGKSVCQKKYMQSGYDTGCFFFCSAQNK